jgi:hypothetical protein
VTGGGDGPRRWRLLVEALAAVGRDDQPPPRPPAAVTPLSHDAGLLLTAMAAISQMPMASGVKGQLATRKRASGGEKRRGGA